MRFSYASLIFVIFSMLLLGGCSHQQSRARSTVVDYLYPNSQNIVAHTAIPTLKLPVNVGIAFVPDSSAFSWQGDTGALTSVFKEKLMQTMADQFETLDFVGRVETIPTAYLSPGGSFSNLNQIKNMFDVDVIALVSYDQVQFTDEGFMSLSYWTIFGAYLIEGERNDTSTMMDTVVYDISSRQLLFRAPGVSRVKGTSTWVNLSEQLRDDSAEGFTLASVQMLDNLQRELEQFKVSMKSGDRDIHVVHRPGHSGGGAVRNIDFFLLVMLLALPFVRTRLGKINLGK